MLKHIHLIILIAIATVFLVQDTFHNICMKDIKQISSLCHVQSYFKKIGKKEECDCLITKTNGKIYIYGYNLHVQISWILMNVKAIHVEKEGIAQMVSIATRVSV